jgi:hypothetical protein
MCMRIVEVGNKRPENGQDFHLSSNYEDLLPIENDQINLNSEKAIEILRKHGLKVTTEQARLILEFLRKLADIAVTQYLRK